MHHLEQMFKRRSAQVIVWRASAFLRGHRSYTQCSTLQLCSAVSQQTGLPLPLGRGVCETKSKKVRSRRRKYFMHRVYSAQRGFRDRGLIPWSRKGPDHGVGVDPSLLNERSDGLTFEFVILFLAVVFSNAVWSTTRCLVALLPKSSCDLVGYVPNWGVTRCHVQLIIAMFPFLTRRLRFGEPRLLLRDVGVMIMQHFQRGWCRKWSLSLPWQKCFRFWALYLVQKSCLSPFKVFVGLSHLFSSLVLLSALVLFRTSATDFQSLGAHLKGPSWLPPSTKVIQPEKCSMGN